MNLLVVVTLATAVAIQQIPAWLLVNLAVVTAVLRVFGWRYGIQKPMPTHLAVLNGVAWLGMALVFWYEIAGLGHPVMIYMEMYQALVRLMVLMLMISYIWYGLWSLKATLGKTHDIQKHKRLSWRPERSN